MKKQKEKAKRKSEKKIARQQVIAIKPLDEKKVSEFIYSFANLGYTVANNRKRLIELFVRKTYCFKDKIMIFYNASLDPKQEIKLEKNTENELLFVFGVHGGTQAHTLGTIINFKSPKNISEQQNTKPNQFNKGLKRKHSLKTKYEQEKKSTYTKITQTKQANKQSQIIKAQFNPKHLLLVVGIDS